MAPVKKILSWILPVKVETSRGQISPVLEVSYENGVKVLNAERVNYSFGALHKVFQAAFTKIELQKKEISTILILGFGVGSIAKIIREEYKLNIPITGVEADEEVLRIGREHFGTTAIAGLKLIHAKAEEFLGANTEKFDLIAVDIFVEEKIPAECKTEEFLSGLKNSLTEKGVVIMNEMPEKNFSGENEFEKSFRNFFSSCEIHNVRAGEEPNRIYVGRK